MNPWEQLLIVQELDTRLDQLAHRLATLPARDELAEADKAVAAHAVIVAEVQERKDALALQMRHLENDIADVEAKRTKSSDTLYAGASNDTKALQALQDEIKHLSERITGLEDEELEIMEQLETVNAELDTHAGATQARNETLQRAMVSLAEGEADVDAEQRQVQADRDAAAAVVSPEALATYDSLRSRNGGLAVAHLDKGSCGACHMKLSAVEYDRVKHLPVDEAVQCEDCGRYLVR